MNKTEFIKVRKDIAVMCDYLAEEKKHYEESDCPRNHIWCHVKRVRQLLEREQ
jgi:hypothetical protein